MHDAAEAGSVPIIKALLNSGALVQRDQHNMTPMLAAALLGHCKVSWLCILATAMISAPEKHTHT